jgi:hypothetical protein
VSTPMPADSPAVNWPAPPTSPPPGRPRRSRKGLWITLGVISSLILIGIIGGTAGDQNRTPTGSATSEAPPTEPPVRTTGTTPNGGTKRTTQITTAPTTTTRVLLTVRSSGIKKTAPFSAIGDQWTLAYSFDCRGVFGSQGNFIVELYDGTELLDILANELGAKGANSTAVYQTGTRLHLEINSECRWTIKVTG